MDKNNRHTHGARCIVLKKKIADHMFLKYVFEKRGKKNVKKIANATAKPRGAAPSAETTPFSFPARPHGSRKVRL
jgi:hypothetical protein